MKFASIGTPAASPSRPGNPGKTCAGFTLFEALVALALVLAFVQVLGPYLFHARRIMAHSEGRVAAQVLLRSLLDAPFDRSQLANVSRGGETSGPRLRVVPPPLKTAAGAGGRGARVAVSVAAHGPPGGRPGTQPPTPAPPPPVRQ